MFILIESLLLTFPPSTITIPLSSTVTTQSWLSIAFLKPVFKSATKFTVEDESISKSFAPTISNFVATSFKLTVKLIVSSNKSLVKPLKYSSSK